VCHTKIGRFFVVRYDTIRIIRCVRLSAALRRPIHRAIMLWNKTLRVIFDGFWRISTTNLLFCCMLLMPYTSDHLTNKYGFVLHENSKAVTLRCVFSPTETNSDNFFVLQIQNFWFANYVKKNIGPRALASFITARAAMHATLGVIILSVLLSVCHMCALWQN